MNPILPVEEARAECLKLIEDLDSNPLGHALMAPGHGRMFGVLVCTDGTVLRAFSGELEGELLTEGFVTPLFDVASYRAILYKYDRLIKSSQDHRNLSRKCWEELKELYRLTCFDGSVLKLTSVLPNSPSGTGDCCAPRLLSHAYSLGKKPSSLCEFFYGSGTMEHKSFQNPCDSRCRPLLPFIIGLDIIYQDKDIVVVNKPSGMLSIEGKGPDKQDCIASRVRSFFPCCISQPCIHRLDQATSGLMVLGLTKDAHDRLSLDFENRQVHKEYEALVDGLILEESGTIDLPIRLDVENRPHQIVDLKQGKNAVTDWIRLSIENMYGHKVTRLRLIPKTGRTHQLRVHCASGLGHPILGDTLYGSGQKEEAPRLMLQARSLSFNHPISGKLMSFELAADF